MIMTATTMTADTTTTTTTKLTERDWARPLEAGLDPASTPAWYCNPLDHLGIKRQV